MKNNIFFIALFSLFIFTANNLNAGELTINDITNRIQAQQTLIKSYTADISTIIEGGMVQGKNVQNGKIFFQAPGTMRTDSLAPFQQTILTKDNKSFIIDQLGQATEIKSEKNKLEDQFKDPLALFKKFDFVIVESDSSTLKLIGTPKSSDPKEVFSKNMFSKVIFYIDKDNFLSKEIRVHNAKGKEIIKLSTEYKIINNINFPVKTTTSISINGSSIQITNLFLNLKLNEPIDPAAFDLDKIKAGISKQGV